jgi:hypothetical protein
MLQANLPCGFASSMLLVFRFSDIVVVRLNLHILLSGKYLIHSAEAKCTKVTLLLVGFCSIGYTYSTFTSPVYSSLNEL